MDVKALTDSVNAKGTRISIDFARFSMPPGWSVDYFLMILQNLSYHSHAFTESVNGCKCINGFCKWM